MLGDAIASKKKWDVLFVSGNKTKPVVGEVRGGLVEDQFPFLPFSPENIFIFSR